MHTWWGRKSSRSKGRQYADGNYPNLSQYPIKNDKKREKDNCNSFADVLLLPNSPPKNGDFTGSGSGSSAFSGFDSHRGHPLPRPSFTDSGIDDGSGLGSGSGSVSSVSSSGYSDDPALPPDHTQFGISSARERGETKLNALMPRSPDPGTRGTTTATATSPLHPRYSDMSLESPTRKQEEGKGESHPLPLPPVSPTSPYILPRIRTCRVTDKPDSNMLEWKRGRLLGRGTFGHVYLGFNSETGQMCAIKEVGVIADDQVSKECLKQLNQEIILLSQLSHPNIVQYYGSELGAEKLSVYLEYVSGGSIHKLLQEYGAFKEPVIQNYTRQILSGLAYLHGRKTVHRDIKGANILVDSNGEIKLADFGMAKHINGCSSVLSFKGSPYWMAPEVVMHTNGYSLPVDIWSLGCTIIEMATSKPPWCQFEGVAAIFKIGNSKSRPEIPGHLSPNAKSFLNLCFQRDPLARPTALQLQDHPFVRDQMTSRVGNINLTKGNFSYTRNGSRTPKTAFELHSRRRNINFFNGGRVTGDALIIPRESARMITSLPASPCSSPLQHSATGYKRSFLSPPQSSVALVAQNGRNLIEQCPLAFPTRSNAHFSPDPWPHFTTSQTPDGSPILRQF